MPLTRTQQRLRGWSRRRVRHRQIEEFDRAAQHAFERNIFSKRHQVALCVPTVTVAERNCSIGKGRAAIRQPLLGATGLRVHVLPAGAAFDPKTGGGDL